MQFNFTQFSNPLLYTISTNKDFDCTKCQTPQKFAFAHVIQATRSVNTQNLHTFNVRHHLTTMLLHVLPIQLSSQDLHSLYFSEIYHHALQNCH